MAVEHDITMTVKHDLAVAQIAAARAQVKKLEAETKHLEHDLLERDSSSYEARVYTFAESVNSDSASECISVLSEWSRRTPKCDITIIFNSPGGRVFDGFGLYDFIRGLIAAGHKIETRGLGQAFSMGGILLQAGSTRTMTPHSYLMIHEITSGTIGKTSELLDETKLLERLQKQALTILAGRSTMTERQIKNRWNRKDWYLDAAQALELGFIDKIA